MLKENKKNKKIKIVLIVLGIILTIYSMLWLGQQNRKRMCDIHNNGILTIGTIYKKGTVSFGGTQVYALYYVFYEDRERKTDTQHVRYNIYKSTQIGMKFEVKYLLSNRLGHSKLYVNKPVSGDYGVETTGVLLDIYPQKHRFGDNYLKFQFYDWFGNSIESTLPTNISAKNKKKIIGHKYKVRFLPSTPIENAILYIDEPIEDDN